jgi:type I restriction enzyme S subunit
MSVWKNESLTNFVTFQRGFDLPKSQFVSGDIPVFGSTSILGYHNLSKVDAPGVITGRSGTLGKFQYSTVPFWPHNTTLWVKDFKGNNPKFTYYIMQCFDFSDLNGGGAVPTLNRNVLKSLKVDVPPLPTQKKIAKILSNYDDLIENNLKRIKLLEESARLTYEEWFLRFRVDDKKLDIDPESGLPFGWEWKPLNSVCKKISSGGTPSRANKKYWDSDDYDWVTTKELKDGYIYNTKEKISSLGLEKSSAKLYPKGTIVMAIYASPTLGRLGVITKESCFNQAAVGFIIDENFISNEFLYCKLIDERTGLNALAIGAAQQNINVAKVKSYEVAIPNFELIEKFTYIVKPIFNEIENLGHQNQLLKEARDILLPRLMTGMIDTDKLKVAV